MLDWICRIFVPGRIPDIQRLVFPSNGGKCLTGCYVVAQTQDYLLVCIWGSLFKFQGGGVGLFQKVWFCARLWIREFFVLGLMPVFPS